MKKFCNKCGGKLDENTGKCPNCDVQIAQRETREMKKARKKAEKKAAKKEAWNSLPFGMKFKKICLRAIAIILSLVLLSGIVVGTLTYFDIIDVPAFNAVYKFFKLKDDVSKDSNENAEEANEDGQKEEQEEVESLGQYTIDHPDADDYYQTSSDIISTEKASESADMLSESDVYALLAEHGFTDLTITTTYLQSGEYIETKEISKDSSEKHPIYETVFATENGEIWGITIVANNITAYPLYYNSERDNYDKVILGETDYTISYDSKANKFYKAVPHEDVLNLKTIERIDAVKLEELTGWEIDEL